MADYYLPSSGTEGMDFESEFCDRCEKNRAFWESYRVGDGYADPDLWCPICNKAHNREQPEEWQYVDGEPVCTEFKEAK